MTSILQILDMIIGIAIFIIFAQAILSWLIAFNVLSRHQNGVAQIYQGLSSLTEPIYRPIRERLPATGGIDLAPLIVLIGLFALQTVIGNNLAPSITATRF
ncbi:MAG: YggT family protein [Pseudomonadota bacterium]